MKTLVTHNGAIHGDDLFACATLSLYLEKKGEEYKVIRSQDKDTIEKGDYVFDVGGVYDPEKNRFDHHQKETSGARENGVLYASFGLVWKHFGMELCDGDHDVWQKIDQDIVSPIDATDNGMDIATSKIKNVREYNATRTFLIFTPTWQEDQASIDDIFREEVKNVKRILKREIDTVKSDVLGRRIILEAYNNSKDKRIIELENNFPRYLYQETLSSLPEPIYMICQSRFSKAWKVEAVQGAPYTLKSRKPFPEAWRGRLGENQGLAEVTGVSDAVFCHRDGFLLETKTKESAFKLAEISLKTKTKKSIWHLLTK